MAGFGGVYVGEGENKRGDGTQKGTGFFGVLPMRDGSGMEMTEYGIGVTINGNDVEIPTVVPTLSKQELEHLLSGGDITDGIVKKAVDHAKKRLAEGKSAFIEAGEQTVPVPTK